MGGERPKGAPGRNGTGEDNVAAMRSLSFWLASLLGCQFNSCSELEVRSIPSGRLEFLPPVGLALRWHEGGSKQVSARSTQFSSVACSSR